MWKIRFTKRVASEVRKFPKTVNFRIKEEVEKILQNPYKGKELKGKDAYRHRFGAPGGEWRIIYKIYLKEKEIYITEITTREKAPY